MRMLLALLVAGGLVFFVFLRSSEHPSEVGAASAGTMLPPEDAPAAIERPSVAEPSPASSSVVEERPAPVVQDPVQATPPATPASIPAAPTSPAPVAGVDSGAELGLAAAIAHAPREVELLAASSTSVPDDRKLLARVVAGIVLGETDRVSKLAEELASRSGVRSDEAEFVKQALRARGATAIPATASTASPIVRAGRIGMFVREAEAGLRAGASAEAARDFSQALLEELEAPWPSDPVAMRRWSEALHRAQRGHRWKRAGEWPAVEVRVEEGDSLISLRKKVVAEHPQLLVSTGLIARSNELSGEVIHPREVLRIPTERVRMLVVLKAHWALYLMGDEVAASFEVGVGLPGSQTKPGEYVVGDKRRDPMWFPPGKDPVPYGDPRNPLGSRWIELELPDGQPSHLGFHGTNEPESVGKDASQGCLRMRKEDVELLYEILPKGVAVTVRP